MATDRDAQAALSGNFEWDTQIKRMNPVLQSRLRRAAVRLPCLVALIIGVPHPICAATNVIAYFEIGREDEPDQSIAADQFMQQMDELAYEHVSVVPVAEIISELAAPVPSTPRVAITFDDAYSSVGKFALPALRQRHLPATLFVTPRLVDKGGGYMSWNQIRRVVRDGFTIGAKVDLENVDLESDQAMVAAVNQTMKRIEAETGVLPTVFAYGDGIAAPALRSAVKSRGLAAAFGLQSGPLAHSSDPFLLPRFAITDEFGSIDRFRIAINAVPIEVQDVLPADPAFTTVNPPAIGFSVTSKDFDLKTLNCYIEGQGRAPIEIVGNRIEIRPADLFEADDETHTSCMAPPVSDGDGWHWVGFDTYVTAPN